MAWRLLLLLASVAGAAEVGPTPREFRRDALGHPLPAGAVARFGMPPALSGFAFSLAWTADGTRFVAADWTAVAVFDAATGRRVETLHLGDDGKHVSAPLPRDGGTLLRFHMAHGSDLDVATATGIGEFLLPPPLGDLDRKLNSITLTADRRLVAGVARTGPGTGVGWLFDRAVGRYRRLLTDRSDLQGLRLSPDGRRVYAIGGAATGELTARDVATGAERWTAPLKYHAAIKTVSDDGRRLVVHDSDGLTILDADTGKRRQAIALEDEGAATSLWGVDLSADGGAVAIADGRNVRVWDVASGKLVHTFAHTAKFALFSPDGKSLLTASAWVQRWDLATGRPAYPTPVLGRPIPATALRWSADGRRLLAHHLSPDGSGSADVLAVWDAETSKPVWSRTGVTRLSDTFLEADGRSVRGLTTTTGSLTTWDLQPERETSVALDRAEFRGQGMRGTFLPDGRLLARSSTALSTDVIVYSARGVPIGDRATRVAVTDGRDHVEGSTLYLNGGERIDLVSGRPRPTLLAAKPIRQYVGVMVRTPDVFVAGRIRDDDDTHGLLWESATGSPIGALPPALGNWSNLVVSRDGRFAAWGDKSRITLFDLARGGASTRFFADGDANILAFSPDGSRLASAQPDGTVLVWPVERAKSAWSGDELADRWTALKSTEAATAWRAVWQLIDHPAEAVAGLDKLVEPFVGWKDTPDLISRLDHPRFPVREAATKTLAERADAVEVDLRRALAASDSEEQRARLRALLERLDPSRPPSPETMRSLRTIVVLERIGTPAALDVLKRLAGGATGSRVTAEAMAAAGRLAATR